MSAFHFDQCYTCKLWTCGVLCDHVHNPSEYRLELDDTQWGMSVARSVVMITLDTEMNTWLVDQNMQYDLDFRTCVVTKLADTHSRLGCVVYIEFETVSDMMAFKLRWL